MRGLAGDGRDEGGHDSGPGLAGAVDEDHPRRLRRGHSLSLGLALESVSLDLGSGGLAGPGVVLGGAAEGAAVPADAGLVRWPGLEGGEVRAVVGLLMGPGVVAKLATDAALVLPLLLSAPVMLHVEAGRATPAAGPGSDDGAGLGQIQGVLVGGVPGEKVGALGREAPQVLVPEGRQIHGVDVRSLAGFGSRGFGHGLGGLAEVLAVPRLGEGLALRVGRETPLVLGTEAGEIHGVEGVRHGLGGLVAGASLGGLLHVDPCCLTLGEGLLLWTEGRRGSQEGIAVQILNGIGVLRSKGCVDGGVDVHFYSPVGRVGCCVLGRTLAEGLSGCQELFSDSLNFLSSLRNC